MALEGGKLPAIISIRRIKRISVKGIKNIFMYFFIE
jgi:hypothetical protein